MVKQREADLGQVLKVFWMWKSNFPHFLLRCMFRALIYFSLFVIVFVILIFIPGVAKLVDTDAGRIAFLLTGISWVLVSTWWTARDCIVVRERGLEIHKSFTFNRSHTFTTWENVSHIGIEETIINTAEDDELTSHDNNSYLYINHHWPKRVGIGDIIYIPITQYSTGNWFRRTYYRFIDSDAFVESDFGHYFHMYAPQVIEKLREEQNHVLQLTKSIE